MGVYDSRAEEGAYGAEGNGMSGGGYGGGMGGMGNFANGGYPQRFGGFGGMQGYGGQPQGYSRYQGQQSFGGGNPWMRGGGMQPQGYGNKMGFQPMGQPDGRGLAANLMGQNGGLQVAPSNDAMTIPGETYASGGPPASTPQPSIGGPGQGGPSALPPGGSPSTSTLDYQKSLADQAFAKGANIYGPNGAPDTSAQYNQMVQGWQQQYQALMGQPAPFGRYADGSPREDPNALNARAQAHQQWYGGGWGR